jgi:hypothetical protein
MGARAHLRWGWLSNAASCYHPKGVTQCGLQRAFNTWRAAHHGRGCSYCQERVRHDLRMITSSSCPLGFSLHGRRR